MEGDIPENLMKVTVKSWCPASLRGQYSCIIARDSLLSQHGQFAYFSCPFKILQHCLTLLKNDVVVSRTKLYLVCRINTRKDDMTYMFLVVSGG